jgi:hypothetical protein
MFYFKKTLVSLIVQSKINIIFIIKKMYFCV